MAAVPGTGDRMAWFAPALLVSALVPALYFNGIRVELFALYSFLLFAALGVLAWQWFKSGIAIPNTSVALWLSLFWLWLGASLLWHPIPMVGLNYFWIVGTFPLAFWLYTLAPDQQHLWKVSSAWILLTGLVLALWAASQMLVLGEAPRSVFLDINSHAAFLNLIALPASAYFLLQPADKCWALRLMGAVLFVLFFAIMLTKGRGAITSFIISFALLLWLVRNHVPVQRSRLLLLLALCALLFSNLLWQGGVVERLSTLAQPASADLGRLLIWSQAWKMLGDAPWYGMGIGTFWLAWPPYRDPADGSGGYFAHNDYLQIWIEAGWPGLLLLLILLGSVLWTLVRVLRNSSTSPLPHSLSQREREASRGALCAHPFTLGEGRVRGLVEMAGLCAGLLAIAAHSFFNFNLYISPTLLVAGLVLARFNQLAAQANSAPIITLQPARWLRPLGYHTIATLLVLFPLIYFTTQGASALYYRGAIEQASRGQLEAANRALHTAARLTPLSDSVLATHADLVRHLINTADNATEEDKKILYDYALELLAKAERLNPLRTQTYLTRGQLYQQAPAFAGADWAAKAEAQYRRAITLDPRYYPARAQYATLLLPQNRLQEARRMLEAGMPYTYLEAAELFTYYDLTRQVAELTGDARQAKLIADQLQAMVQASQARRAASKGNDKGVKLN